MELTEFTINLWRWKCNLPALPPKRIPTLAEVFKSQWSPHFEQLMRNRLAMGYFRYAPLSEQPKGLMNNIGSIETRLETFKNTGNDELLVDIANICMVEFLNGKHPNKHFKSEDDGIHVERNQ